MWGEIAACKTLATTLHGANCTACLMTSATTPGRFFLWGATCTLFLASTASAAFTSLLATDNGETGSRQEGNDTQPGQKFLQIVLFHRSPPFRLNDRRIFFLPQVRKNPNGNFIIPDMNIWVKEIFLWNRGGVNLPAVIIARYGKTMEHGVYTATNRLPTRETL